MNLCVLIMSKMLAKKRKKSFIKLVKLRNIITTSLGFLVLLLKDVSSQRVSKICIKLYTSQEIAETKFLINFE